MDRPPVWAPATSTAPVERIADRYSIYDAIGSGGMATVHLGRMRGPAGFARTVVIKKLHPALAEDRRLASLFMNEARIAARLHHPNVVSTLDVVYDAGRLHLILEYVHAESLSALVKNAPKSERLPAAIAGAIVAGVLHGLHAAHEERDDRGHSLEIVHRDVSPQNILVGADGVSRLIDFGIARTRRQAHVTTFGRLKGKLAYLAPEQLSGCDATRRTDVYATGVVLWELLTGRRLFSGDNDAWVLEQIRIGYVAPPSKYAPRLPELLDRIVLRALSTEPGARFATARDMALELESVVSLASVSEVGNWVMTHGGETLKSRERRLAEIEARERAAAAGSRSVRVSNPFRRLVVQGVAFGLAMIPLSGGSASEASSPPQDHPPGGTSNRVALPLDERMTGAAASVSTLVAADSEPSRAVARASQGERNSMRPSVEKTLSRPSRSRRNVDANVPISSPARGGSPPPSQSTAPSSDTPLPDGIVQEAPF